MHLGISPPFQPYLEVQARHTAYTVSFSGYSSVCRPDVVVSDLPDGSRVELAGKEATAHNGSAVLPSGITSEPVTGQMVVSEPGGSLPTRFAPHTYWPGSGFTFSPGA